MSLAWRFATALLLGACANQERGPESDGAPGACEDVDRDGYGRGCTNGSDCDDADSNVTHHCRSCARPEHGCPCNDDGAAESCFLPSKELPGDKLQCSEGTRVCRDGVWSGCEGVHEYILDSAAQTQRIPVPAAGRENCDRCDLKCFKVIDNLLPDSGVGGGTVANGPGGGIVLLPGSGSGDAGVDGGDGGGPIAQPGCLGLTACCSTLTGPLQNACHASASAGDATRCDNEKAVYCGSGTISGPPQNCTPGSGPDTDCDGIPNAVDSLVGNPFSTTSNQTIFHQLDVGETAQNSIDVSFKLKNADVYFLLDTTGTMIDERDNLLSTLTTGNVVNCAQLSQCCNGVAACTTIVTANNQTNCYNAQPTYCGGRHVDCADANFDGAPDNQLKTEGVIGAVRCLVGTSWFGTGYFRDLPAHDEPEPTPVWGEGQRYGDRDELLFRHLIDLTPDYERVRTALASMSMNYNWDEPEGGFLALNSLVSGRGHYLGVNRPAVARRLPGDGCRSNDYFGYGCFRNDAVPIVVFLSDAPHHNGPADSTNCNGRGAGCPYSDLHSLNTWTSGSSESASDRVARYISQRAETFSTALSLDDVRGKYYSLVGNTEGMTADYPTSIVGCGAAAGSPDALVTFTVGGSSKVPVQIKLTKNDAYNADLYGRWNPSWLASGTDDPTPATEFGAVISLFKGIPASVSTTINVGEALETAVASGPNGAYLTYDGTTAGTNSKAGVWGGISGCSADGQTNQSAFTFRPSADARIVFDATGSAFPVNLSLHDGRPSDLPSNPSPDGITNSNDTFPTANTIPTIDGTYVERNGDTSVPSIHADYTTRHDLVVSGQRTNGSNQIKGLSHAQVLYPGLPLSSAMGWSADPVAIASVSGNVATMTAKWNGATDPVATSITFNDTVVGCDSDPASRESVFKFDVATPRRVRIDTEGSSFDTVISLHDGAPVATVTRNDVSGNGVAPGLDVGELTSKVFNLSDVGTGTTGLPNTYDFVQCGGAAAANDAVFRFTLAKPTRIGMDVSSGSWDPIVGLFAATPGQATVLTSTNTNDSVAFALGDVLGQVTTRVNGSSLSGMADNFASTVVGCGALAGGLDQVFRFTPSANTTVRIQATPTPAGFYPVLSVFDGPPPVGAATTTNTAAYNAGSVTLPDTNCQAFSFADPASGAAPPHVYTLCPTRRYSDDANTRCTNAGMDYLASVNTPAEQAFLAALVAPTSTTYGHHIGAKNSGSGFQWRGTPPTALTYTNWAAGEPNEPSSQPCAAMQKGGRWEDKRCTSSGASADDNAYYLCEDVAPAVAPAENLATAQTVNPAGKIEIVEGSTLRMYNDYNAATLMGDCGGTVGAGDAVFKIVTGASGGFNLSVDTTGSGYSPVIGLFDGSIDSTGYKACDAAGGAPLTYTLLSSRTYYIVVDGTAASLEGSYKLKLTDTSATMGNNGVRIACGAGSSMQPRASVDVEVEKNHTYYLVADAASATVGAYTLDLSALYLSRTTLPNSGTTNERGVSAFTLPDPYRSKITVTDATTGGMAGDYGSDVICSGAASSPDAVYKLRPTSSTGLKLTVTPKGAGLTTPVLGLFDGPPPTTPVLHDLAADGNANDAPSSAEVVSFGSSTHRYDGNTSAMQNDTDPALGACGSAPDGRDAVFSFSLTEPIEVEIDASASTMTDPVVRLFKDGPLMRPTAVALSNDDRAAANANPASAPNVQGAWLHYTGDFAELTSESQVQTSVAAGNDDSASPLPVPQDLGDLAGRRVTLGGGDTSSMEADYPGACGAADGGRDKLYTFTSSTATQLHVKAAPAGHDMVLALYRGDSGAPLRSIDLSTVTEDRTCAISPSVAPRNVTRPTLLAMQPDIAGAVDVELDCANPTLDTTDPDGAGAQVVTFSNWCGPQPTAYVQTQAGGPDAVVLLMNSLRIASGTTLRVIGTRPLILVVTSDAGIAGVVNASGDTASSTPGAGGGVACGASAGGDAETSGVTSGGGGGGGFSTAGGQGGTQTIGPWAGGSAGAARGNDQLVPLLGGCNGGRSGATSAPGFAGGAVQISVLGTLDLTGGTVNANGSNGVQPSFTSFGGTGGGSGGAVLVEAGTLTLPSGVLQVNGGAGATGNGAGTGASGGAGSTAAGVPGGAGGDSTSVTRGGGGGGGGYGRVRTEQRTMTLEPCRPESHEDSDSAAPIDVDSSGQTWNELGSTQYMSNDYDLGACGAGKFALDAVYAFTLSKKSDIQIDTAGSASGTIVGVYEVSALTSSGAPIDCLSSDDSPSKTLTLPTGDYRIVVSNKADGGGDAYELTVQNRNYAAAAATEVACDGSGQELVHNLQANTPYYLLVKGATAAEGGGYGLYLETPGTGPSMDCAASVSAPDAVYKFNVPSQRSVSIDTEGSATDTVIALYPGSATTFGPSYATDASGVMINCDDDGGALPGASRIDATLTAGDYYVVVKRKNSGWSSASEPFSLAIRDSETTSPIACGSRSVGAGKIVQSLPVGDYRVVVSGQSTAGGAYAVKFRDVTHFGLENGVQLACVTGAGNSLTYNGFVGGRDYYVVVKGNNASESGAYEMTVEDTVSLSASAGSAAVACAAEGARIDGVYPAGTYYALVSGNGATAGGPYTLRMQDLDAQNDMNRLACNDNGGPNASSAIEADLSAGTHYVVVKGKTAGDQGAYRLRVRDIDSVSDRRLACAPTTNGSRLEYDVKAGRDYTLLLKGGSSTDEGAYSLKMYDAVSSPSSMGSMLQCEDDPQPSPLRNSTWDRRVIKIDRDLDPATYYVAVKGVRETDAGHFQLQIGQTSALTSVTYNAPTWNETRDALVASGVRVLPVIATQGETSDFVAAAEAQAQVLAQATGAVKADGTPIWQKISKNGTGTGTALVSAIAELAAHLAMDVSLHAVDGPDQGSRFKITIAPQNSPNCTNPHPLVDATGACSGTSGTYNCNTQYKCRPGAAPKFRVTFTNPESAPVPPNTNNPHGGYLFKLQLKGDGKYLLDEIPVFLIPTNRPLPPPPGSFASEGKYEVNVDATSCQREQVADGGFEINPRSTSLPQWRDLFFKADIPEGTAIDFELCTRDSEDALKDCDWSDQTGSMRKKITITSQGSCKYDSDCLNIAGKGNGFCSDFKTCQFVSLPKVEWESSCVDNSACLNGPFGAGSGGEYMVSSHCETDKAAYGYGHCVYHSVPLDIGATLLPSEDGRMYSRLRIKLRSNDAGNLTPTLYSWYMTYRCEAAL